MSQLRFPAVLPLVLALFAGCTAPTPHFGASATGSMQLAVSTPEALPAEVSRITLTITSSDMPTISTDLVVTDGAWGGIIGDIPAGAHRTFLAQAFTSSNALRYQGQADDVTVTAGATGLVSLTLQDVSPPPPFANEAPLVDSLVVSATTLAPGASLSLSATAHDPNPGDSVGFAWSAPSGSFSTPTQASTTWTAPGTQGPVTLTLTVSDSRGASLTQNLTVTVSTGSGADEVKVGFNTPPRVVSLTSTQSVLDVGRQTALSLSATDADGDSLSYQWSATCSGSFTGTTTASTTFTPSALPTAACNNCQVSVVIKDGRGGQNTGSISLCVSKDSQHAPPSLTRSYQSSLTAKASQQLTFEVGATDPAGSALSFAWTATVGTLGTASTGSNTSRILWTAPTCLNPGSPPGLTATVTNAYGLKTTKSFTVTGPPACSATAIWSSTGAMSTVRYLHAASLLSNGKVLVSGGYGDSARLGKAEVYDPATGTWSPTGSMNTPRYEHQMVALSNGKVLVSGGSGETGFLATAEVYDPATGVWSSTGPMTSARYEHQMVLLPNGKVLAMGGFGNTSYVATAELYDPTTNTWSATSSMASARYTPAASSLSDGRVLVAGGYDSDYVLKSEVYNPTTSTWSTTGPMTMGRYRHRATRLLNGKVLVSGGHNNSGDLATAELFDPTTNTWSATGSMAMKRQWHTSTLLPNGQVLVTGGYGDTGALATTELYDPSTGTWSSAATLSTPRNEHQAVLLPNGKVLTLGGYDDFNNVGLNTAEVYGPTSSP